jgi:uncharacterized protein YndB with AHSA1/START domain
MPSDARLLNGGIHMTQLLEVQWPNHYEPRNCPIHIRNELDMAASQENVWAWLTRLTLWPTWYVNSANMKILEGSGPDLKEAIRFRCKTFGVTITSMVLEYVPNERIAWDGHALGIDVYHAWVLVRSATVCRVLTEETQHGWLARLGKLLMPNRMHRFHQVWLEELERKAQAGLPPPAEPLYGRRSQKKNNPF